MGILETLRVEMRRRIINAGVIPQDQYQREWHEAPDVDNFYIRETVIDMGRSEPSQSGLLQNVLCEYDIFVNEKWLNPTLTADNIAEKLQAEFDVKSPEKIKITLPDWDNVQAWVSEPVYREAAEQDSGWYKLPVLIHVECLIR